MQVSKSSELGLGVGHGTGGLGRKFQYSILRRPSLPVLQTTASDMFEGDYQVCVTLSKGEALMEVIRRTFQSRIENEIGTLFIAYPLEPEGRGDDYTIE